MSQDIKTECSICGHVTAEIPKDCDLCHGGAQLQERAYTLSERRAGIAPSERARRGFEESLNPRTSDLVVGGAVNHPYHPEN